MKENEVNRILEHLDGSVGKAVEKYVNGHLREMKTHLTAQDVKLTEMSLKIDNLKVETAPIIESKNVFVGFRNFLVWIATPVAIIYALLEFLKSQ